MTAEQAFDTPNYYAATSVRLRGPDLGDDSDGDNTVAEQPKAVETPEQRQKREEGATLDEIRAMHEAYDALHKLSQAQLNRAFAWLHARLERTRPDPWGDEPPF